VIITNLTNRMSTKREEGWLEADFSNKAFDFSGKPRWVAFDYEGSSGGSVNIYGADTDNEPALTIPMASVLSFKTDVRL
jgi:hypothetical protein